MWLQVLSSKAWAERRRSPRSFAPRHRFQIAMCRRKGSLQSTQMALTYENLQRQEHLVRDLNESSIEYEKPVITGDMFTSPLLSTTFTLPIHVFTRASAAQMMN